MEESRNKLCGKCYSAFAGRLQGIISGKLVQWWKRKVILRIAKELEIELRAINYVKWHVKSFIQDMRELLSSLDIDEGLLDSILMDGHAFARAELRDATIKSITLSANPDLRKKVYEKIYSESYLV